MEKLFVIINPAYCLVLAGVMLAIGVVNFIWYKKTKDILFLLISLVCVGLFYDTFITGVGYKIQDFSAYYIIGMMRHVFHALLTPLILVYVFIVFRRYSMFRNKIFVIGIGIIVCVISIWAIIAIFTSPVNLINYGGVIRHSIDKENAHILSSFILKGLSYGTLIPMGVGAYITIKKQHDFHLLIATISMLIFTFVGVVFDPSLIFLTSFVGEALLVLFFFLYARKMQPCNSF